MESGFSKANNNNLPRIDAVMLGRFFASNSDFCSSEFRNVKTSMSSRASYGDDAISYVQLKRDRNVCTIKCKICPEHKVHAKLYGCTLVVDEEDDVIISVQCQDCVASQGGCKHAIALLMWVHRRSEEPSCTSVECYWKKSKLSRVGSSLKYMTAKDLSQGNPILPANSSALKKFLEEARKRKVEDCELLKYQPTYCLSETQAVSMHQLICKFKTKCVDKLLSVWKSYIHISFITSDCRVSVCIYPRTTWLPQKSFNNLKSIDIYRLYNIWHGRWRTGRLYFYRLQ